VLRTSVRLFLLLPFLAGCKSGDPEGSTVVLLPSQGQDERSKFREATKEKDPEKHRHVWEEWAWHTAEDWSSGIPMTKIVTVYRCKECGEIRDESVRRKR
jgi:hypothetical protein